MIGFLVWNTGSGMHPVAFVYAEDREACKRILVKYLHDSCSYFYNPDNWTVEPVTRKQEYVHKPLVICPDVTKFN